MEKHAEAQLKGRAAWLRSTSRERALLAVSWHDLLSHVLRLDGHVVFRRRTGEGGGYIEMEITGE